ncbi:hypothetical protein CERSUDRAFT_89758, partial [Gelatoporia subvermispora B]
TTTLPHSTRTPKTQQHDATATRYSSPPMDAQGGQEAGTLGPGVLDAGYAADRRMGGATGARVLRCAHGESPPLIHAF